MNICKCAKCGKTENLEIHHNKMPFAEMVDKTIADLGLAYYIEKDNYSNEEIDKISTYLLGLHIKSDFRILCNNCHDEEHRIKEKYIRTPSNPYEKIMIRKPVNEKSNTNSQILLSWLLKQDNEKIFKVKEMLQETGLSNDAFKDVRKSNKTIKSMFEKMQTDKKGYYRINKSK